MERGLKRLPSRMMIEVDMSDSDRDRAFVSGRLAEIAGSAHVRCDEPMSSHTTFKVGGPADFFVKPETTEQLTDVIRFCREQELSYFILGNGSNLLVSDRGYRGVIINIADNMAAVSVDDAYIRAQAGAMLTRVSRLAGENGLSGLEFASGIPGTIGGAVCMNAGAYGGEMKEIVCRVHAVDEDGELYSFENDDMDFSYRHSIIEDRELIVVGTELKLEHGDRKAIDERVRELGAARREKQPLEFPSAGSTFKRPEGYFAGKLIMDAGLRGYAVGGAQVSEKHCGFVVNRGGATACDVMTLIRDVQHRVMDKFGVMLETEVRLLGEF